MFRKKDCDRPCERNLFFSIVTFCVSPAFAISNDDVRAALDLRIAAGIELRHTSGHLTIQADAQPEFEMGYDSAGDFYPLAFDALLRPKRKADGTYTFTWFQGGGSVEAERLGPAAVAAKWTPTEAQIADYVGNYPLMPILGCL